MSEVSKVLNKQPARFSVLAGLRMSPEQIRAAMARNGATYPPTAPSEHAEQEAARLKRAQQIARGTARWRAKKQQAARKENDGNNI